MSPLEQAARKTAPSSNFTLSSGASPQEARGPSRSRSSASAALFRFCFASATFIPSPAAVFFIARGKERRRGVRGGGMGCVTVSMSAARGGLGTRRRRSRLPVSHRALGRRAWPNGPPLPTSEALPAPGPGHLSPAANPTAPREIRAGRRRPVSAHALSLRPPQEESPASCGGGGQATEGSGWSGPPGLQGLGPTWKGRRQGRKVVLPCRELPGLQRAHRRASEPCGTDLLPGPSRLKPSRFLRAEDFPIGLRCLNGMEAR